VFSSQCNYVSVLNGPVTVQDSCLQEKKFICTKPTGKATFSLPLDLTSVTPTVATWDGALARETITLPAVHVLAKILHEIGPTYLLKLSSLLQICKDVHKDWSCFSAQQMARFSHNH
jgi:hypothetical protein